MKFEKHDKKWLIGILVLVAVVAIAEHYGRYVCDDCTISTAPGALSADARNFITTNVNQDVDQWQSGDTVEICNGSQCVIVTWRPSGFTQGGAYNDTGGGTGGGGGDGSAGSPTTGTIDGNGGQYVITCWQNSSGGPTCSVTWIPYNLV